MLDRAGRVVFINDHLLALLERDRDEMLGSEWMDVVPARQRSSLQQVYLDAVATGTSPGSREDSVVTGTGQERRLAWTSVVQHDADGQVSGLAAIAHDVTDLRRSEADRALLSLAVEQTADAVVVTDATANIVFVNAAYEAASGYSSAEVVGQRPTSFVKQGTDPVARELWATLSRERPWRGDVRSRRKNGIEYINAMSITPVFDDDGRLSAYVSVQRDVDPSARDRVRPAARGSGAHPPRSACQHCDGASSLEDAARQVCDQLVDLPGIDRVRLISFTSSVRATVVAATGCEPPSRGTTIQLPDGVLSRLFERTTLGSWGSRGGFDRQTDQINAALLGADVTAAAFGAIRRDDLLVGVVIVGTSDASMVTTVADKLPALIGFGTSSNAVLVDRLEVNRCNHELRVNLEHVVATQAFWTLFQPVVEIGTGRTTGYEALTRFASGERPDICFAQAWSVGVGVELELATLELAIATARGLPAGQFLDLNISPRLLIAVDDAGVGIANFSHIIELRPDFVKLDASLVRRVNADPGRQALVAEMSEFARTAGCHLIAEGVETAEEASTLAQLGVALAQGYFFGRPETTEHWASN